MDNKTKDKKTSLINHPIVRSNLYLICWSVFAFVTGIAGGLIGGTFALAIRAVTAVRTASPWVTLLLPAIGAAIALLYRAAHEEKNGGTNMILSAIAEGSPITVPTGPLIYGSTILSHLGGASVGREGAALQLGGWLGCRFGEAIHLTEGDRHSAIMCGMAAVFAALFGTPVAAAIFCIEVVRVGVFHYAALIPCIFSAFIGTGIASLMGVEPEVYSIGDISGIDGRDLFLILLFALLCAMLSIILVNVFHGFEKLAKRLLPSPVLRGAVCGALISALLLIPGAVLYSGAGSDLIVLAMNGKAAPYAFLLKLLFTGLAIAGGFKGGEIVPTLSIGACFGALFGSLTGLPVPLTAALGMIAVFAGATNCPIAALMIAMEMFQGRALPYFAVTVTISFVLSGYYSLYGSQRFAFSKMVMDDENDPSQGTNTTSSL